MIPNHFTGSPDPYSEPPRRSNIRGDSSQLLLDESLLDDSRGRVTTSDAQRSAAKSPNHLLATHAQHMDDFFNQEKKFGVTQAPPLAPD